MSGWIAVPQRQRVNGSVHRERGGGHAAADRVLGLCRDGDERTLLVATRHVEGGRWQLPGGMVEHGERPEAALRRHLRAQLARRPGRLGWSSWRARSTRVALRLDRLSATAPSGIRALGRPGRAGDRGGADNGALVGLLVMRRRRGRRRYVAVAVAVAVALVGRGGERRAEPADDAVWRRQRFAAYALRRIRPAASCWPGSARLSGRRELAPARRRNGFRRVGHRGPVAGADRGDQPAGRLGEALVLSHRYQRDALGPEGVPIDWHGVRVVYRVYVDVPTEPRVTEGAGSTVAAGWFHPTAALALQLTEVARESIAPVSCRDNAA